MSLTYARYLHLEELLDLQRPLSDGPEHDEMLFIVIHQVYELWFKQVTHELRYLQRSFVEGDAAAIGRTFKRVLTILKTMVSQVDVLETMTPISFLSFRERLATASGFQSMQFRRLEAMLGHREPRRLALLSDEHRALIEEELKHPSLFDAFVRFIDALGYRAPASILERDVREPHEPSEELQHVLVQLYRDQGPAVDVAERMVDLDEGIQEWRYRHVKMVERTIGAKQGTGGSSGFGYLRQTLFSSPWPDLWLVRSRL